MADRQADGHMCCSHTGQNSWDDESIQYVWKKIKYLGDSTSEDLGTDILSDIYNDTPVMLPS